MERRSRWWYCSRVVLSSQWDSVRLYFAPDLVCEGENEVSRLVTRCRTVGLTDTDLITTHGIKYYMILVNCLATPGHVFKLYYFLRFVLAQQCITNTTHSHSHISPPALSLHTLSLTWFHSLWGRKSPEVHSGWSDEKWEKSLWPELSGGGVWLYGVTGWEDRKELVAMSALLLPEPLLSSPLPAATQHQSGPSSRQL